MSQLGKELVLKCSVFVVTEAMCERWGITLLPHMKSNLPDQKAALLLGSRVSNVPSTSGGRFSRCLREGEEPMQFMMTAKRMLWKRL